MPLTERGRASEQFGGEASPERARLASVPVRVEPLRASERHLPTTAPVGERAGTAATSAAAATLLNHLFNTT